VTNEGESRFCRAAAKYHIAMAGIEKILLSERDFTLFLY
jgi:L-lactate dehydrogenase complex protein LldF